MSERIEINEQGEQVRVTHIAGAVVRELARPASGTTPVKSKKQLDTEALVAKKNWVDADMQAALVILLQHVILGE